MARGNDMAPISTAWAEARSTPSPEAGCWFWDGALDGKRYGLVTINRKVHRAHRVSWAQANGPIPAGGQILHRCDAPPCINPDHLFLGDNSKNVADKVSKGRQAKGASIGSRMCGERQGHAKLKDNEVRAIRASKERGKALALQYGVSQATISEIRSNKLWKHIGVEP